MVSPFGIFRHNNPSTLLRITFKALLKVKSRPAGRPNTLIVKYNDFVVNRRANILGMSKDVKRLFGQFRPKHYNLSLVPEREEEKFSGTVTITGDKTGRPTQRLTFHQSDLNINSATITKHDKNGERVIAVSRINHQRSMEEVRLHASEMVYPGSYTVTMEFSGTISPAMNGIYPSVFMHEGKQKKLIATQFESHYARQVFPSIDEPEAKATFDLTLITPESETVISNTPVKSQEVVHSPQPIVHSKKSKALSTNHSSLQTTFETTPRMSTYLLAFVYGEMAYKEAATKGGVAVRTYATPDNVGLTDFALNVAVKCLEFYNDYFGIDYPLEKCDFIALPDFASGAMENWGCITFREQTLLVDPVNSTLGNKQYVAMVIAHELAHQWFGNLVTMRWWTDLWLNEGFASWIEFLAVDHIFPEWEMWTQFAVDEQQQALRLDALENTHPIEVEVHHPDEIHSIFDAISYSKGASVIHMLHQYLGPDSFRKGLTHYLKRHEYGNTDTVDLWQALEDVSGQPVKDFMHSWTSQPGFPVVHAEISEKSIKLQQERFFLNPEHNPMPEQFWPIALLTGTQKFPERLDSQTAEFPLLDSHDFKLNRGQSGFYRVTYNTSHLQHLGEQIRKGHLKPPDRLGVLSDIFETARSGESNTTDGLHFLKNFELEDNYAVWDVIAAALGNLRMVMDDESLREDMKPFTRKLIANELKRLGWNRAEKDSHFDRLLRPIILGLASVSDEPGVVKRCHELFDKIHHADEIKPDLRTTSTNHKLKRGIDIDPDMRGVVFGTIARTGDEKDFNKLLALHNESTLSEERTTLVAALTGFKQPELIKRALELINSDNVRLQDVAYWIAYSFLNRYAKNQTWEWLKENWDWLEKNLGSDLSFFRTPIYVARVHSSRDFIKEYTAFFEPRLSPALVRSYKQGLEIIAWQSAWRQRDFKEIMNFFKRSTQ